MLEVAVAFGMGVVTESLGVGEFLFNGDADSDRTGSLNWAAGRRVEAARSSRRVRRSERLIFAVSGNGLEGMDFSRSPSLSYSIFGVECRAARRKSFKPA